MRRVDPRTGEVLERLEMPEGVGAPGSNPMEAICSSAAGESRQVEGGPAAETRLGKPQRLRGADRLH